MGSLVSIFEAGFASISSRQHTPGETDAGGSRRGDFFILIVRSERERCSVEAAQHVVRATMGICVCGVWGGRDGVGGGGG